MCSVNMLEFPKLFGLLFYMNKQSGVLVPLVTIDLGA